MTMSAKAGEPPGAGSTSPSGSLVPVAPAHRRRRAGPAGRERPARRDAAAASASRPAPSAPRLSSTAVDALVIPGGESTTISKLLDANELFEPLAREARQRHAGSGNLRRHDPARRGHHRRTVRPATVGGHRHRRAPQRVRPPDRLLRGRPARSPASTSPLHAVFIRAPLVERVGASVEVLATVDGRPVCCRQGAVMVSSFHPELSDDARLHELFVRQRGRRPHLIHEKEGSRCPVIPSGRPSSTRRARPTRPAASSSPS